jgi:hypothetical protein
MGSTPQQPSPRPTLEELLRFKRAERPAPEFWAEFDRGLRQKQLAALVKRPQGWARVRPGFARSLKWIAPATAAVAVALVVVQMPLSTASRSTSVNVASLPVRTTPVAVTPAPEALAQPVAVAAVSQHAVPVASFAPVVARADSAGPAPVVAAAESHTERTLPWSSVAGASVRSISGVDTFVSLPASREVRRPRSSWTSRYNEMAQAISAEQSADRVLQLASFDLSAMPENAPVVALADSAPATYATGFRAGRAIRDRDFRDMESRMGSSSRSSLALKF